MGATNFEIRRSYRSLIIFLNNHYFKILKFNSWQLFSFYVNRWQYLSHTASCLPVWFHLSNCWLWTGVGRKRRGFILSLCFVVGGASVWPQIQESLIRSDLPLAAPPPFFFWELFIRVFPQFACFSKRNQSCKMQHPSDIFGYFWSK